MYLQSEVAQYIDFLLKLLLYFIYLKLYKSPDPDAICKYVKGNVFSYTRAFSFSTMITGFNVDGLYSE